MTLWQPADGGHVGFPDGRMPGARATDARGGGRLAAGGRRHRLITVAGIQPCRRLSPRPRPGATATVPTAALAARHGARPRRRARRRRRARGRRRGSAGAAARRRPRHFGGIARLADRRGRPCPCAPPPGLPRWGTGPSASSRTRGARSARRAAAPKPAFSTTAAMAIFGSSAGAKAMYKRVVALVLFQLAGVVLLLLPDGHGLRRAGLAAARGSPRRRTPASRCPRWVTPTMALRTTATCSGLKPRSSPAAARGSGTLGVADRILGGDHQVRLVLDAVVGQDGRGLRQLQHGEAVVALADAQRDGFAGDTTSSARAACSSCASTPGWAARRAARPGCRCRCTGRSPAAS